MEVEQGFRWDDEFRGLGTMAIELGLLDLPGVVARVPGQGAPPSVLLALPVSRRQVDARLVARPLPPEPELRGTPLELELELCVSGQGCVSTTAVATREAPWDAFAELLEGAAATLGVRVGPRVVEAWRTPGSTDPYAELLTGRAAATYYGILPPPRDPADRRTNPVLRAVHLDPRQPLALWTLARWDVGASSDGGKAAEMLTRAALARPTSPALEADLATVLLASGKADQAVLVWDAVRKRRADDPRFLEPAARALLAAGRAADAHDVVEAIPAEYTWEPRIAELRVAVAEAYGGVTGLDPLLAHWQDTDPRAVAPVRRRLDLRVQDGRFEEALALLPSLRDRAPGPQTDALEVALLVALGRVREAADKAPAGVSERLSARADRERDPGAPVAGLPDDLDAALARAEGMVWRGQAAEAIPILDGYLKARPWRSDAHAVRARALERVGRGEDAADAWQRAWELDPAAEGGPVAVTRVASTFRYLEREPLPPRPVPTRRGRKGPEL